METVVIKTFDNTFSANVLLARLEQSGVRAYLRDEYTVGINPLLTNAVGGVKLTVDVLDAPYAVQLLQEYDEQHLHNAICPECNRNAFVRIERPLNSNIIVTLLSKLFKKEVVPETETIYLCSNCKYETSSLPLTNLEQN